MSLIIDCVVKHREKPQRFNCPIDVVLRSNLSIYEGTNLDFPTYFRRNIVLEK